MSKYILDTDHLTLLQRNHPLILQRATVVGGSNIFITTITLEEQVKGRLAAISRAATKPEKLVTAYNNLRETFLYLYKMNLLDFDEAAYAYYQSLIQQRIRIGTQDLRIASIAVINQAILITRNYKDFSKVPNISLEDWTI